MASVDALVEWLYVVTVYMVWRWLSEKWNEVSDYLLPIFYYKFVSVF